MTDIKISYREALSNVVSPDDMDGILNLLEQHKNWGAFGARVPSYIIVNLVDKIKSLKEEILESYALPEPEDFSPPEEVLFDDEQP